MSLKGADVHDVGQSLPAAMWTLKNIALDVELEERKEYPDERQ
jgi:hypothetical protein